jgi:CHASE3 domain sensor protein
MPRSLISRLCLASLITLVLFVSLPAAESYAQSQKNNPSKNQTMTTQQAAAQAKSIHGGKVLKVTRGKGGYKVKLLQDSGRVVIVKVAG